MQKVFSKPLVNLMLEGNKGKNKVCLSNITKGQLISECLFGVFNFLQKTNKNKSLVQPFIPSCSG